MHSCGLFLNLLSCQEEVDCRVGGGDAEWSETARAGDCGGGQLHAKGQGKNQHIRDDPALTSLLFFASIILCNKNRCICFVHQNHCNRAWRVTSPCSRQCTASALGNSSLRTCSPPSGTIQSTNNNLGHQLTNNLVMMISSWERCHSFEMLPVLHISL